MKAKKLNRLEFINEIKRITNIEKSFQDDFIGKNFYFLGNINNPDYQIEFVQATKNHFFTILVRGIRNGADNIHTDISSYLKSINLDRNIIIDTESIQTLI